MKEQNKLKNNTLNEERKFCRGKDLEKPTKILIRQRIGHTCILLFYDEVYIFIYTRQKKTEKTHH